jgi:uncharacterized protein
MPAPPVKLWRESLAGYIAREAKPQEKYGHQPRLYALTQTISQGLEADDDILYAAAYLHDLGVFTGHRPEQPDLLERWDNVAYALKKTPEILASIGFPLAKLEAVLECIRNHQPTGNPQSLEATILREADILEQLGVIGILRTVSKIGRDTRFHTFTDAIATLQAALDQLPAKLRLPTSCLLAEPKIEAHRRFLASIASEAAGLLF